MCFDKPSAKFNMPNCLFDCLFVLKTSQKSHTCFPVSEASLKLPFLLPPIFGTSLVSTQVPGNWKFKHQFYHQYDRYLQIT